MSTKKHKKHKSDRSPSTGLKLILKVGTPEYNTDWSYPGGPSYSVAQDEPRSHHRKSKKKKKKKDKSKDRERRHRHHHKKRKREESSQDEVSLEESSVIGSPSQVNREHRTCVLRQRQERSPLQKMLDQLLSALEKRDPQQFFAWPVTDNIAPGYSAIISQPMDFSTMKQKIDDAQYTNLQEFIADFRLMCTNAMEYNHVDTIYYKASKKLLHAGLKLMQPEKLANILPHFNGQDLGLDLPSEPGSERSPSGELEDIKRMPVSKFEAVPDDLAPCDVLSQAQAAARQARDKLNSRRRGLSMGFLRQRKDGTTNLNILVGGDGVIPGTKKRPVLLGALTGKLAEGGSQLQGFREDRRNLAKPVKPLYYGAFGSYAPSYDSAFANLSKEESDLVYQTYGSDTAVQYAESILDFAKDCDYTLSMVDSLLDLLTGGDHGRTKQLLDERKRLRDEEDAIRTVLEARPARKINVDELRSLSQLGIDVNFLDGMRDEIRIAVEGDEMQKRLDNTSQLLERLQRTQNQRLSQPLPPLIGATEEEQALAESISDSLGDMTKRVNPGDVAPVAAIRKALGVDVDDLESELRQFLESEPALSHTPDKTIEEILME